jgi:hypothetical protein
VLGWLARQDARTMKKLVKSWNKFIREKALWE